MGYIASGHGELLEYIVYCPRCGAVSCSSYWGEGDYCDCTSLFSSKFIKSDLKPEDFDLTKPQTASGATKAMYHKISEEYVKRPSNKKYNEKAHKKKMERVIPFLKKGGVQDRNRAIKASIKTEQIMRQQGYNTGQVKCPNCGAYLTESNKRGFSKGNAVAGAVAGAAAAGPIGLAGAAVGAVGSRKIKHHCTHCNHTWETKE